MVLFILLSICSCTNNSEKQHDDLNDNVAIRKITPKDTDKIVKWRNSPAVMNNFIVKNKLTKKQHIDWLNNMVKIGKVVQFIAVDI